MNSIPQRFSWPRILAAIALIAALAFFAARLLGGDDDGAGPRTVDVEQLRELPDEVGHPVYWAGERPEVEYELTENDDGVFIRYLDPATPAGSEEVRSLTIGTYPTPGAYATLQQGAAQAGAISRETPDGGIAVAYNSAPGSVYLAYPESDLQIEVYDPDPSRALKIATSNSIAPLE